MSTSIEIHPWSSSACFQKAKYYLQLMEDSTTDDLQFGLWSALSLELLARAALAYISPSLLADLRDWRNIEYSLGRAPTAKKFKPSSISTAEVLLRLKELLPEFTEEMHGFCSQHVEKRNAELHTGELAFASYKTSLWLPKFYLTCKALLTSIGKDLSGFVRDADEAEVLIVSLSEAAAKSVNQDIAAYTKVWVNKTDEEKEEASLVAANWATRQAGHRVECPACSSQALIHGSPSGSVIRKLSEDEDEVEEKQRVIPASFECIACGLRIAGFSKLSACGLGDPFTSTSRYTPAEFFGLYSEDKLEEARSEGYEEGLEEGRSETSSFEPDWNE
jgi:DNA-directed RNA polymerase subunit RPC12/RpoP